MAAGGSTNSGADGGGRKDRPVVEAPDVHLDTPRLKVDELNLNLLGILTAEIKGLDTELLLEADLTSLVGLLERIVDALENDEASATDMVEALGREIRSSPTGSSTSGGVLETVKNALASSRGGGAGENGSVRQEIRHEVGQGGEVFRVTLDENGEVLEEEILGNVSDLPGGR